MAAPMIAALSPDGRIVHARIGGWSSSFAVEKLAGWIRFYRNERDRKNGKRSAIYADRVTALEAVRDELEGRLAS